MRIPGDRGELIRQYIQRTVKIGNDIWRADQEPAQMEKPSALFVYGMDAEYMGMIEPNNWVEAKAVTKLTNIAWRKEAVQVDKILQQYGLDRLAYQRTGGAYIAGKPNKRIRNWKRGVKQLIRDVPELWQREWWPIYGLPHFMHMRERIFDQALDNAERIAAETDEDRRVEMVVADKLPTTGTGWSPADRLNTRKDFARHFPIYKDRVKAIVTEWNTDYMDSVARWPDEGSTIRVAELFKGIDKGSRSDADVVTWIELTSQLIEAGVREVATTPDSVLFNQKIVPVNYQSDLMRAIFPPGFMDPHDKFAHIESLSVPPATADFIDTVDIVGIDADFGWTDAKPTVTYQERKGALTWIIPKEDIKFGADQIVFSGIFMESRGRPRAMLISGSPDTMPQYGTTAYWAVYDTVHRHEISLPTGITGIGDDIAIRCYPDAVPIIMGELGSYLRTKGMHGNLTFREGHYLLWISGDKLLAFIAPRALKSVTSPQELYDLPLMKKGDRVHLDVPAEAREQADQLWKLFPQMICYEGTPQEWRQILEQQFIPGKTALAKSGISESAKYLLTEEDVEDVD